MQNSILSAFICLSLSLLVGCGASSEDGKEQERLRREKQHRNDSLALKVATLPTLDCLPIYVADQLGLFTAQGVNVKLYSYNAQMDCDQALARRQVECAVTDVMRAERMKSNGTALIYVTATDAYWQLIANRKARVKEIRQLGDKMVAMTRYSATDYLTNVALDSVHTDNPVFRVQVNDVMVRLRMIQNNAMDAMMLTEPQATTARLAAHPVLMDSRDKNVRLGAIVARGAIAGDSYRQQQLKAFSKAYDMACDSINTHGFKHYAQIIKTHCKTDDATVEALPKIIYSHVAQPRPGDIAKTKNVKWRTN